MGEVYRARDTRLGREVALKVLAEDATTDPERLHRFEQEARAASSLNHPNIVVVYEVGEATVPGRTQPLPYLAMELIEGEPLEAAMAHAPLPLRQTLELSSQLAEGLARAHESGIVHRDLKPSNVIVARDGHIKIVDFGLAKLRALPEKSLSHATTLEQIETTPGTVFGTVGYMSPEQARGEPTTAASDQFSFGCILYEMLTARSAFGRATAVETLSAILRDEPAPIQELNPAAPAPLRWIVERCLAKSPSERYASTHDLARDLHKLKEHSRELGIQPASEKLLPHRPGRKVSVGAALLGVAALGAAVALLVSGTLRRPIEPEFRRLTFRHGYVSRALFVPNSNSILYTAAWEGQPARTYVTLAESSGLDRSLDSQPQLPMAYSEDGSQVLVLLGSSRVTTAPSGTLAWWPALGGEPRHILENVGWADWAKRMHFFAVVRDTGSERHLEIRNAEGGFQRTLFRTPGAISFVRLSPDEKNVAFIHHSSRFDAAGEVRTAAVDGTNSRVLTPQYDACFGLDWNHKSGEIWFTASHHASRSNTNVWAVSLSAKRRLVYALTGRSIIHEVSAEGNQCLLVYVGDRTSMMVRRAGGSVRDLSWYDGTFVTDISPDERSLLFYDAGPTRSITGSWIRSMEGGDAVHLGEGEFGRFSPDGRWIVALTQARHGPQQIIVHPTGAGESRQLTFSQAAHWAPAFAGPQKLIFVRSEKGKSEIWRMKTDGTEARSLGAAGCDLPMANPTSDSFLCVGHADNRALFVYPIEGGAGRKLYELPPGERFRYARWNGNGDKIFAVTGHRRFLLIDAKSGTVLQHEELPIPGPAYETLYTAAFNAQGTIQAYSVSRFSSDLYLASGLR